MPTDPFKLRARFCYSVDDNHLDETSAEILTAADNWKIDRIGIRIEARMRAGTAGQAEIDYIKQRMRLCPVSVNLVEPPDYQIELEFG